MQPPLDSNEHIHVAAYMLTSSDLNHPKEKRSLTGLDTGF